ncbi:hypothetical protein D3C76_03470 [compost metagenome]
MNIENIKDGLDAFALAEFIVDRESYVEVFDKTVYSLFSDGDEIFKMHVLSDSLVFFIKCSSEDAKLFEQLLERYSYSKNEEVMRDNRYRAEVKIKRYSFQIHIFDQQTAEELADLILKFRGGRK